ncbi:MAG: hypothetical protein JHC21_01865 [Thermocrinis sp.]|nr:hypothetical protein [Thermocrinis sp.]
MRVLSFSTIDSQAINLIKEVGFSKAYEVFYEKWKRKPLPHYTAIVMALAEITGREKIKGSYKGYEGVFSKFLQLRRKRLDAQFEKDHFSAYQISVLLKDAKEEEPIYLAEVFLAGVILKERYPANFQSLERYLLTDATVHSVYMFKLLHSHKFVLPPPDLTSKLMAYYHTTLHLLPEREWLKKELGI